MDRVRQLALLFVLVLAFAIPTDGIVSFGGIALVKMAGLLAFGLTGLWVITGAELRGSPWFFMAVTLYVGWALFAFLWTWMPIDYDTPSVINSRQSIKAHLYLFAIVLLMFQVIRTESDLQAVMVAFLLGTLVLVSVLVQGYDPGVNTVRHQIKGFDANETAVQMAMGLPLAIYLLLLGRHILIRLFGVVYLPLALYGILITGSRTGFSTLLIGLLGFVPWVWRSRLTVKLLSVVLLVVLAVGVASRIPEKTLERIFSTGTELSQGTLSDRSITWARAWDEWDSAPVFGNGLGSFRRIINKHNIDYTAHNSYISIAVEQGVVGLLLYVMVIVAAFWQLWSHLSGERRILVLSLLMVVVLGQMSLTLNEKMYVWFAYILAALIPQIRPTVAGTAAISAPLPVRYA